MTSGHARWRRGSGLEMLQHIPGTQDGAVREQVPKDAKERADDEWRGLGVRGLGINTGWKMGL